MKDPRMFFGRDEFIEKIRGRIINDNHVLIFGERRIGKTSILLQLFRQLSNEHASPIPIIPVFIDIQAWMEKEIYRRLIEEITEKTNLPRSIIDWPSDNTYSHEHFHRNLSKIIRQLQISFGKDVKLVLLLDEIDRVRSYPEIIQSGLRGSFGGFYGNLVVVMAGAYFQQEAETLTSPFFNFASRERVPPLDLSSARSLIVEPTKDLCEFEEDAIDTILQFSNLKPYYIQEICQKVLELIMSQERQVVTVEDVRKVYEDQFTYRRELLEHFETSLAELQEWKENNSHASSEEIEKSIANLTLNLTEMIREYLNQE